MKYNFSLEPSVDNYCVMGNPVSHSKSPLIQAAFARQTSQLIHYQAIQVEPGEFNVVLDEFQEQGGKGLNITVPFKEDAWNAAQKKTERAERANAVNTLWFDDTGKRYGDTTDGIGLIRDLTVNHNISIKDKRVLLLGAGGAVHGILDPLFDENPAQVVIANRTVSRAEKLAKKFSDRGDINGAGYENLKNKQFDILINGTSASLQGKLLPLPDKLLADNACCYDLMYADKDTVFMQWARQQGATCILDGLGMLVEQAAESFTIWRGIRPATGTVLAMLRDS